MDFIRLIGVGIILGVTYVIPGVCGGSMAMALNVYDRILEVITIDVRKIIGQWKFILPLVVGMALGIFLFSKVITFLFQNYPVQTNWFFIGIILGSLPMIVRRLMGTSSAHGVKGRVPLSAIICGMVALGVMLMMTYLEVSDAAAPIETRLTPVLTVKLLVGLALSTVAMIIPGLSGSFLMLVMGIYSTVLAAISDLNIPLLVPAVIGGIIGLLGGAKLIRLLMEKVPSQTYGAILGLVVGSILVVFPGFGGDLLTVATSVACGAIGLLVSFLGGGERECKECGIS